MSESRCSIPDDAIPVLDKGFVRLVDLMGSDSAIVQSARVSYGKGTKTVNEDEGLIRYLLRHQHTSPFEMVEMKFHCRMPIFVARQWIRHRTANVNEISARYSEMQDLFYEPEPSLFTSQSVDNKQGGSSEVLEDSDSLAGKFAEAQEEAYGLYSKALEQGLRRELARVVLPLSLYTEWYWKIDLHNLLRFLKLRMDSHSQYEIRVYADAIAQIVSDKFPLTYKAFEDYWLNGLSFSVLEQKALSVLLSGSEPDLASILPNKRERADFLSKLEKLRVTVQLPPKN